MKKLIITGIIALSLSSAQAQISITKTDFAKAGDTLYYAHDTSKVAINMDAVSGENKSWDYSSLVKSNYNVSWFLDPSESPVPAPSNITHVFVDGDLSAVSFINATDDALFNIQPNPGYAIVGGEQFLGVKALEFPLNYLSTTKDSVKSVSVVSATSLGMGALADSLRITIEIQLTSICDGWGSLKTPDSSYQNTLRIKNTIVTNFKFEGKRNPLPIWVNIPVSALPLPIPAKQTSVTYGWLGAGSKYFMAESNMVTDTPDRRDYFRWQTSKEQATGLFNQKINTLNVNVYPNPASAIMNVSFFADKNSNVKIELYDATGRLVKRTSERCIAGKNAISVSADNCPAGLYHLVVTTNEGSATTKVHIK